MAVVGHVTSAKETKMNSENFEGTVIEPMAPYTQDEVEDGVRAAEEMLANKPHESLTEAKPARTKRTEAEMIASLGGTLEQAMYLKRRVRKLEEKIAELFSSVSGEAANLVLKDNDYLDRYLTRVPSEKPLP